jgi:hypothetical protein
MYMAKKDKITVQGTEITVISEKNKDYIPRSRGFSILKY